LGDTYVVLDRSSSHEWRVRNEHTGQEGWVPPPCIDTQGSGKKGEQTSSVVSTTCFFLLPECD